MSVDTKWIVMVIWSCVYHVDGYSGMVPACDSNIYCNGSLLHSVQTSGLFEDSKTFVDMSLKASEETIIAEYHKLKVQYNYTIPREKLAEFVDMYFAGPGEEFIPWTPTDLPRIPSFLRNVTDPFLKDFGWDLCNIWKDLGRQIKPYVLNQSDRHSLIYLPKPFIVPGGRFRETYYWDTYWIIKGLLVCQMNETAKGMLENFSFMIKTLGHIPNGGRVYYLRRSQPPMFIPMVHEYYRSTGDKAFIRDNIAAMEKEYKFWLHNRSVEIQRGPETYSLARYAVDMAAPRPESYVQDLATTQGLSPEDRLKLYSNLVSACESGWDFSSRWYSDPSNNGTINNEGLRMTNTKDIVPVDLNSILCWNERILADFYALMGDASKAQSYAKKHERRRRAINSVLWDTDAAMWFDFSLSQNRSRPRFYASNLFPVFAGCGDDDKNTFKRQLSAVNSYIKKGVEYQGGVPCSLDQTGQQWDFPNVWPPLQHMWIIGLSNTEHPTLTALAFTSAQKWVQSNYLGWKRTRTMFEKYSAEEPGSRGAGGEYNVQEGFGWTNGVMLDLLAQYGGRLTHSGLQVNQCTSTCRTSAGESAVLSQHKHVTTSLWIISFICILFIAQ